MSIGSRRAMVRILCHSAMAVFMLLVMGFGNITGSQGLSELGMWGLAVYLLTVRRNPLPAMAERLFIRRHRCHWCGRSIPLEASWQCTNCSFLPRERHAFNVCAGCGFRWSYVHCPYDDQVILL